LVKNDHIISGVFEHPKHPLNHLITALFSTVCKQKINIDYYTVNPIVT